MGSGEQSSPTPDAIGDVRPRSRLHAPPFERFRAPPPLRSITWRSPAGNHLLPPVGREMMPDRTKWTGPRLGPTATRRLRVIAPGPRRGPVHFSGSRDPFRLVKGSLLAGGARPGERARGRRSTITVPGGTSEAARG